MGRPEQGSTKSMNVAGGVDDDDADDEDDDNDDDDDDEVDKVGCCDCSFCCFPSPPTALSDLPSLFNCDPLSVAVAISVDAVWECSVSWCSRRERSAEKKAYTFSSMRSFSAAAASVHSSKSTCECCIVTIAYRGGGGLALAAVEEALCPLLAGLMIDAPSGNTEQNSRRTTGGTS